jgi:hypothetical protein
MTNCVSGKRVYESHDMAVEALVEARTRYTYSSGNGPIAVYKCDECGFYHLTSKGQINSELEKRLKNGKIDLEKEANRWLDRMKKSS